ncbi:hypothetical protein Y032_0068g246 [Ancylostoma ceylanicum]|uniref:Uncharacterized protein n=1 Tax=Ancylostoma ceylanicum TaxID=53326 RepID=A0A016TZK7_9BILA|nr:hypothetical protein Y032_0068g246 [Ancylostoma ceylanicum]
MISGVQFGPRLNCFGDWKGSAQNSIKLPPQNVNRKSHDRRGRFTVFDDEPVNITPTHPLAQHKTELSEMWTRRNEDLDWDSLVNSDSSNALSNEQVIEKRRSLEELTSLKFTSDWNVGVDSSRTPASDGSNVIHSETIQRRTISSPMPVGQTLTDISHQTFNDDGTAASTTGLEDSRMSFPLHDLTGPVRSKQREEELMRYMGINNLNFERAKRFAPKDLSAPIHGTIHNSIFRGFSTESSSTDTVVQERMIPDPHKSRMKELTSCINVIDNQNQQLQPVDSQLREIEQLTKYLSQSKANLMCITMDGNATLESAERMIQRGNEWFHQMLDDLEKRIKDERRIRRSYHRSIKKLLEPVVKKLCDLEVLYESLNFLDKRTSKNEKTISLSRENMRQSRKILAKLMALDSRRIKPPIVMNSATTLAAEASTAFFLLEQDFLEIAPFIARSSQAAALMDTVITQMRGVHKCLLEEVPRRSLSEYNAGLTTQSSQSAETAKEPTFLGIPPLQGQSKNLSGAPKRRKFRSYMKLDPWPTEVDSKIPSVDGISSSEILSAKISTLPLSDYHESARSNTPTGSCESCKEKVDMFANFNPNRTKNLSEDRPPTDVGTRGCTLSETSICNSFEEAKIIPNPNKNTNTTSISSASAATAAAPSKTPSSAFDNSTQSKTKSVSKKVVKHSKTPDPIRSYVKKGKRTKTSKSKKGEHGRKAKKIVIKEELLAKSPAVRSPTLKTAHSQMSEHSIPNH